VNHPGVVAILDDFITDDGTAVLVLELVQGRTLAALAKEAGGLLEPREVVDVACTVLEILAVAHDANVIHRDIKPENILRCENGTYKLTDFGLAALHHELGALTGTNASLGTPAYMSPEQARGDTRQVDARADIWSVGATMFTLLTGRFLHAASPSKNLVVAAATESVPPVLSLEPDLYPPLAALIDRAVKMNKEERWPNARAMLEALRSVDVPSTSVVTRRSVPPRDEAGMSTAMSSLTSWTRPSVWLRRAEGRSKRRMVGALLGGLAVAVGVGLWLGFSGPRAADGETRTATIAPDRARGETPAMLPVPDKMPVSETPKAVSTNTREATPPRKRAPAAATRDVPRTEPTPSSTPPVQPRPSPEGLSVPDEVLDRRD
jgi:serine/threonine-protein kinase